MCMVARIHWVSGRTYLAQLHISMVCANMCCLKVFFKYQIIHFVQFYHPGLFLLKKLKKKDRNFEQINTAVRGRIPLFAPLSYMASLDCFDKSGYTHCIRSSWPTDWLESIDRRGVFLSFPNLFSLSLSFFHEKSPITLFLLTDWPLAS